MQTARAKKMKLNARVSRKTRQGGRVGVTVLKQGENGSESANEEILQFQLASVTVIQAIDCLVLHLPFNSSAAVLFLKASVRAAQRGILASCSQSHFVTAQPSTPSSPTLSSIASQLQTAQYGVRLLIRKRAREASIEP